MLGLELKIHNYAWPQTNGTPYYREHAQLYYAFQLCYTILCCTMTLQCHDEYYVIARNFVLIWILGGRNECPVGPYPTHSEPNAVGL